MSFQKLVLQWLRAQAGGEPLRLRTGAELRFPGCAPLAVRSPALSIGSHPGLLRAIIGKRPVGSATELLLRQRPKGLEHSEVSRSVMSYLLGNLKPCRPPPLPTHPKSRLGKPTAEAY